MTLDVIFLKLFVYSFLQLVHLSPFPAGLRQFKVGVDLLHLRHASSLSPLLTWLSLPFVTTVEVQEQQVYQC